MSRRTYSYRWCYVCGRDVSAGGLGWYSHCMKHVREGAMTTELRRDGKGHRYYRFDLAPGTKAITQPPRKREKPPTE